MEPFSVAKSLNDIKFRINSLKTALNLSKTPRLVAISKTKPVSLIKECYDADHRVFGENYVQELFDKSKELPRDIQWHFVGTLQSNKVKQLLSIPNLHIVETVHSKKIAKKLDAEVQVLRPNNPLNVLVQVNTSNEESKSGIDPKECVELVQYIMKELNNLKFCGLMTIGRPNAPSDQPDFRCLVDCKKQVCEALSLDPNNFELSMGMSHDFEEAIKFGSTNVRIGSSIFGARDYSKK